MLSFVLVFLLAQLVYLFFLHEHTQNSKRIGRAVV